MQRERIADWVLRGQIIERLSQTVLMRLSLR